MSGREDPCRKGLDVASSWHSCVDPSGLTPDQHWQVEPHRLCLLADGWHSHEERAAKAPVLVKSNPQALSLLRFGCQQFLCVFAPCGFSPSPWLCSSRWAALLGFIHHTPLEKQTAPFAGLSPCPMGTKVVFRDSHLCWPPQNSRHTHTPLLAGKRRERLGHPLGSLGNAGPKGYIWAKGAEPLGC